MRVEHHAAAGTGGPRPEGQSGRPWRIGLAGAGAFGRFLLSALALALFLAGLDGRPAPSLAAWRAIPMPGWALLDLSAGRLVRPFSSLPL